MTAIPQASQCTIRSPNPAAAWHPAARCVERVGREDGSVVSTWLCESCELEWNDVAHPIPVAEITTLEIIVWMGLAGVIGLAVMAGLRWAGL